MNDYQFKLARIEGEFIWHNHPDTDEVFIVLEGEMGIAMQTQNVWLKQGDLCVVPKGVEHKPFAHSECKILFIERKGTSNTGETGGERTAEDNVWV